MEDLRDFRQKYCPNTLDEFWGNEHIKVSWRGCISEGRFPMSIILHSNFGTGKTSLAKIFIDDIIKTKGEVIIGPSKIEYRPEHYVFPDIINSIKYINSFSGVPHVFFFDEAQRMSEKIQHCLLRIIDDSVLQTYIFATTDLTMIDEGIQSRSDKFNLRLQQELLIQELRIISELESIEIDNDTLNYLIDFSNCIPRECLGNLQILSRCKKVIDLRVAKEFLVK